MVWTKNVPPDRQREIVRTNLQRNPRARIATDRPEAFEGMERIDDLDTELNRLFEPEHWQDTGLSPQTLRQGIQNARSDDKDIIVRAADLYKLCKLFRDGGTVLDVDTCPAGPLPEAMASGQRFQAATRPEDGTLSGNHYMRSGLRDPIVAGILQQAQKRIDGSHTIAHVAYDPSVDTLPSDIRAPYVELRQYLDLAKAHGFDASNRKACRQFELMPWPQHAQKPWGRAMIGSVMTAQEAHEAAEWDPDLPAWRDGNPQGSVRPATIREQHLHDNRAWDEVDPHIGATDAEIGYLDAFLKSHGAALSEPQRTAAERLLVAKREFKDATLGLLLWSKLGPRFASTMTFAGPHTISRAIYEECLRHGPVVLTENGHFVVPEEHRIDMQAPHTPHPTSDSTWQIVE